MKYYKENSRYYPEKADLQSSFPPPIKDFKGVNKTNGKGINIPSDRCTTEPLLVNIKTGKEIPPRPFLNKSL